MIQNEAIAQEAPARKIKFSENNSHVHWLKEGANYFGKDESNGIIYPGEGVALFAGILFLNEDNVLIRVAAGEKITHKRRAIDNTLIYSKNAALVLEYASYKFQIIEEDLKYGLLIFR